MSSAPGWPQWTITLDHDTEAGQALAVIAGAAGDLDSVSDEYPMSEVAGHLAQVYRWETHGPTLPRLSALSRRQLYVLATFTPANGYESPNPIVTLEIVEGQEYTAPINAVQSTWPFFAAQLLAGLARELEQELTVVAWRKE